jgi:hypothetical protein
MLRLKRLFVDGLPRETAPRMRECLMLHGVGSAEIIDRPELQKLEVVFFYNVKEGSR